MTEKVETLESDVEKLSTLDTEIDKKAMKSITEWMKSTDSILAGIGRRLDAS